MNYIAEIKAFYDRLELNPQPNTAIALWHALMSIANKAGWPDMFTVAQSVLGLRSGLNASALKRARNQLATSGLIEWKPRGGNQSAQYKIISLVVQNSYKSDPQNEPQSDPQSEPQNEPQNEPINKHKQKQKDIPPISPADFEEFWAAYPKDGNRQKTEVEYCRSLISDCNLTETVLLSAVKNYAEAVCIMGIEKQFVKNPDRFLSDATYVQYLDGNYIRPDKPKRKNTFTDFEQRNMTKAELAELEEMLLSQ